MHLSPTRSYDKVLNRIERQCLGKGEVVCSIHTGSTMINNDIPEHPDSGFATNPLAKPVEVVSDFPLLRERTIGGEHLILSAQSIRKRKPIEPFHERTVSGGMTFGLGPAGYDIRCRESVLLWPLGSKKVSSVEHFDVPADLMGFVADKSTQRRRWISTGNTKIEPGWRGYLTLELSNHSWWFKRVRADEPIAQIIFVLLDEPTELPYRGKYQDQPPSPVGAIMEKP